MPFHCVTVALWLGTLPIQAVQIGNDTKSQTFESDSLSAWSVKTASGGSATVRSAVVFGESFPARLSETARPARSPGRGLW